LNVLERLVILAEGDSLGIEDLPAEVFPAGQNELPDQTASHQGILPEVTAKLERDVIVGVLAETGNNKALAAQKLGIPRGTLYYKMQKLHIGRQ